MNAALGRLDAATHERIFAEKILPQSGILEATTQARPKVVILAGQPGAGKGGLTAAAAMEFGGDVVAIDPDQLRDAHPRAVQRPAGARDAFFDQQCKLSTVQGLNASMEHSGAQWPQAMQQFRQHHEQAQSRQQEQQSQSQANQQATSAAPAVHR